MTDDAERAAWRTRGLAAGRAHAEALAARMRSQGAEAPEVQDLIGSIGLRLQDEARALRDGGSPEALIEEYTRAVVESVMLGMHALHAADGTPPG